MNLFGHIIVFYLFFSFIKIFLSVPVSLLLSGGVLAIIIVLNKKNQNLNRTQIYSIFNSNNFVSLIIFGIIFLICGLFIFTSDISNIKDDFTFGFMYVISFLFFFLGGGYGLYSVVKIVSTSKGSLEEVEVGIECIESETTYGAEDGEPHTRYFIILDLCYPKFGKRVEITNFDSYFIRELERKLERRRLVEVVIKYTTILNKPVIVETKFI